MINFHKAHCVLIPANGLGEGWVLKGRASCQSLVEFAKIDPELTKRLGQIVINWAVIEEWLGHMLGTIYCRLGRSQCANE